MATIATRPIPPEVAARLPELRRRIAEELPELVERGHRMEEAALENTLSGRIRRAIHESRRPLDDIAADAGLPVNELCDFLEGSRTTRSDVLDRIGLAIEATFPITLKNGPKQVEDQSV